MPTLPSHHGCEATHSSVSYPSSISCTNARVSPSERNFPRTSCTTNAYPRAVNDGASRGMNV